MARTKNFPRSVATRPTGRPRHWFSAGQCPAFCWGKYRTYMHIHNIYIYIHTYRHVYIHVHVWYIYICTVHSIRYVDLLSVYVFIYIYIHVYSFIDTSKRARDRHNLWTFALLCGCHIPRWRTEPPNLVYSWLSFKKGWSSDGRLDKLQLGLMEQSAAPVCWCQEMSRGW